MCYPTTASNTRANYTLPNGQIVPHMHRGLDAPIFANAAQRYPVLVLSHGLGGSPIDEDYLLVAKRFALEGYVVISAFHADQRYSAVRLGSLGAAIDVLTNYPLIAEMMAIRAVGVKSRDLCITGQ